MAFRPAECSQTTDIAITAAANRYNVPRWFLYALVHRESSFNPDAVGPATHDYGLAQLNGDEHVGEPYPMFLSQPDNNHQQWIWNMGINIYGTWVLMTEVSRMDDAFDRDENLDRFCTVHVVPAYWWMFERYPGITDDAERLRVVAFHWNRGYFNDYNPNEGYLDLYDQYVSDYRPPVEADDGIWDGNPHFADGSYPPLGPDTGVSPPPPTATPTPTPTPDPTPSETPDTPTPPPPSGPLQAESDSFAILAIELVMVTQPTGGVAGQAVQGPPTVGGAAPGSTVEASLNGASFMPGSVTQITANSNGQAHFTSLLVEEPGNYTITFSVDGGSITSDSFVIDSSEPLPTRVEHAPAANPVQAEYRVLLLDRNMAPQIELDRYISAWWKRGWQGDTRFELVVPHRVPDPANPGEFKRHDAVLYLREHYFVEIQWRELPEDAWETEFTGVIEYGAIADDDGENWAVGGGSVLARRLVEPPPGASHEEVEGSAEQVMRQLVLAHAVSPARWARRIPFLTLGPSGNRGAQTTVRARYDRLLDKLREVGEATSTGWEVRRGPNGLVFHVLPGVNRSLAQGPTTPPTPATPTPEEVEDFETVFFDDFDRADGEGWGGDWEQRGNVAYFIDDGAGEILAVTDEEEASEQLFYELWDHGQPNNWGPQWELWGAAQDGGFDTNTDFDTGRAWTGPNEWQEGKAVAWDSNNNYLNFEDAEVFGTFRYDGNAAVRAFGFRASGFAHGSWYAQNDVTFRVVNNDIEIAVRNGGSTTHLDVQPHGLSEGWYQFRLRVEGNTARGRIWPNQTAEPNEWMVEGSTTQMPSSGTAYVAMGRWAEVDAIMEIPEYEIRTLATIVEGDKAGYAIARAGGNRTSVQHGELDFPFYFSASNPPGAIHAIMRGSSPVNTEAEPYPDTGIVLAMDGARAELITRSNGNVVASRSAALNLSSGWHWVRFETNGSFLGVKVWEDGTGEPGQWLIEATENTVLGTGFAGVGMVQDGTTTGVVWFDDVKVWEIVTVEISVSPPPRAPVLEQGTPVVFDLDIGNVEAMEYEWNNQNRSTVAYVGGQGHGEDRLILKAFNVGAFDDPLRFPALYLEGSFSWVRLPREHVTVMVQDAITVEGWVYPEREADGETTHPLWHESIAMSTEARFRFRLATNGGLALTMRPDNDGGNVSFTTAQTVPVRQWSHVSAVVEFHGEGDATATLRIASADGQVDSEQSFSFAPAGGWFTSDQVSNLVALGFDEWLGHHAHVRMQDWRFWHTARTGQQIANDRNRHLQDPAGYPGLVAYYRFNEGAGIWVRDHEGGHDGLIEGVGTWVDGHLRIASNPDPIEEPTGLDRREVFIDARDIVREDSLRERGIARLREDGEKTRLSLRVEQTGPFRYRHHWDIGDVISVRNRAWGVAGHLRVKSVEMTLDADGSHLEVDLGSEGVRYTDLVERGIKRTDPVVQE